MKSRNYTRTSGIKVFLLVLLISPYSQAKAQGVEIPAGISINIKGNGQTTGHIAILIATNHTGHPISFSLEPMAIPSGGKQQSYIVPSFTSVSVEPGTTLEIPIQGFCINVNRPPAQFGADMSPPSTWIPISLIVPGWRPSTTRGWEPSPETSATIPGTDISIGHTIDIESFIAEAASILLVALENISAAYDEMYEQGIIKTPFASEPEMERESVIQQTFWIFSSMLAGFDYNEEDFKENIIVQFEENTGQGFESAPEEIKEGLESGISSFWSTFQAVGERAKVFRIDHTLEETEIGESHLMEDELFLVMSENVASIGTLTPIDILASTSVVPDGFIRDPDNEEWVVPDATGLEIGRTRIGPRRFRLTGLDQPQYRNQPDGPRWQRRLIPEKIDLGNGIIIWLQKTPTTSYVNQTNEKRYRGGSVAVHFKWEGDRCQPGRWRQIFRETVFVGSNLDDLVPAILTDGRYVPADPPSGATNDWAIDTNENGRNSKNPDYPHQDNGEMIDTPRRAMERLVGHFSSDTPPRTRARAVAKDVEFISLLLGPDGEICSIMKWGFRVTWYVPEPHDPFEAAGMDHAIVNTTYSGPRAVDQSSSEGKEAENDYKEALNRFLQ